MVYSFARSSFETTWSRKFQSYYSTAVLLLAPKKNLGTALITSSGDVTAAHPHKVCMPPRYPDDLSRVSSSFHH